MLCKHRFVDDALTDPDIFAFLRAYMSEVVRTLSKVQGVDLAQYQRTLLERFSNTYIKDKLSRLALDGSQKFMNTLKDALLAYREKMAFTREITAKAANWILPRDRHAGSEVHARERARRGLQGHAAPGRHCGRLGLLLCLF